MTWPPPIYSALGVDLDAEVRDKLDRPLDSAPARRIAPLYSGETA